MKVTVLSPHRDDAAFSVGLAIAAWLDAGHAVEVVDCFTRSEYCPYAEMEHVHANDRRSYVTALRHREDLRWSRKYRRPVSLVDLNLRDAPQRLSCRIDEVCGLPVRTDDAAIAKIRSKLEQRSPQALVLPLGLGEHVDHLTARCAAQDGWPATLPIAFYEDLPYAARPGAAETIASTIKTLDETLQPAYATAPTDVDAAVKTKRDLALCYDSQIDTEVTEQIARFCEQYGGRERLWVNAAWRQSGIGTWP